MPQTYTVTDPTSGRQVKLTGDSPPTAAELEDIFSKLPPASPQTALPAAGPSNVAATAPKQGAVSGVVQGALKGLGNTVVGLGELAHKIPGVSTAVDALYGTPGLSDAAFPAARQAVQPQGAAENVGFMAEQVGEFFTPLGAAGKVGKAGRVVDAAKSAGLTMAQTGSPAAAGVSAGLSAVLPGAGAASRLAPKVEASAEKTVAQSLGATKEWAKAEAAKLAPEILKRGIGGSREAMLAQAKEVSKRVGQELEDAYAIRARLGQTVDGPTILGYLGTARDALMMPTASGSVVAIPGTQAVVKELDELATFIHSLGTDIPIDKAATLKRTWDHIVSNAGLFGPKATSSATDSASAWAFREASGSFRKLINANPTLEAINAESAFWTGLKKVLKATEKRTQSQRGGLTDAIRGGAGAVIGATTGGPAGAALGAVAAQQLSHIVSSPAWKTKVSAPMKKRLADALASGSAGRIESAITAITRATPSLATQAAE